MTNTKNNQEAGFYSNVTAKRVNNSIIFCAFYVFAIAIFLMVGDISVLETHPIISMAVAFWLIGFAIHNAILVIRYALQK